MVSCSYCGARSMENGRALHKFPRPGDPKLQLWLKNMGLPSFKATKHSRLCSDHFEEKHLSRFNNIIRLLPGSIPTSFEKYKTACVFCHALRDKEKSKSFHKFPMRDPQLLQQWLAAMNLTNFVPHEKDLLCSDHFEKECFRLKRSNPPLLCLKSNAVPSLFSSTEKTEFIKIEKNDCQSSTQVAMENQQIENVTSSHNSLAETYQEQMKCAFSEDVPIPKMRCYSPSVNVHQTFEEIIDNSIPGENNSDQVSPVSSPTTETPLNSPIRSKSPISPTTAKERLFKLKHDHQYENSPETMKRKLIFCEKKIETLTHEKIMHKQKIARLKKEVTSLKEIVSKLLKDRALPV